jgi:hypothetical protein
VPHINDNAYLSSQLIKDKWEDMISVCEGGRWVKLEESVEKGKDKPSTA